MQVFEAVPNIWSVVGLAHDTVAGKRQYKKDTHMMRFFGDMATLVDTALQ